jgi:hypothetical protein
MADVVCNSFSYMGDSPFVALWKMVGDIMGDHRQFLAEMESPYCIFGGAVRLRKSCVPAHVLGPGFDQGVAPRGPFQPPEVLHELGETYNVSFRPGSRHFTGGRGGGGEHSKRPLHEALSGRERHALTGYATGARHSMALEG